MEIEFEKQQPPPPQIPRGHYERKSKMEEPPDAPASAASKPKTHDAKVLRDLSQLCEEQIPDTPVNHSALGIHLDRIYRHVWPVNACVARPVTKKELLATPAALEARDQEWNRLIDKRFST